MFIKTNTFSRKLLNNYYTLLQKSGEDFWWIHDVQNLALNTTHFEKKLKKGIVCKYLSFKKKVFYQKKIFKGYFRYLV